MSTRGIFSYACFLLRTHFLVTILHSRKSNHILEFVCKQGCQFSVLNICKIIFQIFDVRVILFSLVTILVDMIQYANWASVSICNCKRARRLRHSAPENDSLNLRIGKDIPVVGRKKDTNDT